MKKRKVLKYFEIPLEQATKWDWRDYVVFIIETLWTTVFPFISGMLLVARRELIWLGMLIFPIYFRLRVEKKFKEGKKKKKIYVR